MAGFAEEQPHDVELRADRPDLYKPQIVNPFYQSDTVSGDVETALAQLAREHWTLMVLHDVRSDAMRHLDHFLAEVQERGGRLRQDFPGSCLPITCGRTTGPLADFVSSASEQSSDGTFPLGSHKL